MDEAYRIPPTVPPGLDGVASGDPTVPKQKERGMFSPVISKGMTVPKILTLNLVCPVETITLWNL
jgi:hypothetical protein